MRFFHPRIALIQPLIPIPDFWELSSEPQSEWAREFASFRALYREGHSIIVTSDSRSRLINFAALKQSAEATLGKVVVAIDWVAEGGTNQVRVEFFSNSSSAEKAPFYLGLSSVLGRWDQSSCSNHVSISTQSSHRRGICLSRGQ